MLDGWKLASASYGVMVFQCSGQSGYWRRLDGVKTYLPLPLGRCLCNPSIMSNPSSFTPPDHLPLTVRAHWTIYLPSLVVALVWAGVYGWAVTREPALDGLASVALLVEALGVPLLLIFAALRARVLRVELCKAGKELYLRTGVLRARDVTIGLDEIAHARVRRSIPQRFLGGGALDIVTLSGERIFVADLDHPDLVATAIAPLAHTKFGQEERLK